MKKVIILLIFSFLSFSCEKENLVPASEIPDWLKNIINQNEKTLSADEKSPVAITAWIRYQYLDNFYFEYINPILSSGPPIYDWNGNLYPFKQDEILKYGKEKCCKQYVWKGPSYFMDD